MTTRTKAGWLFGTAAVLLVAPYLIVFGIGSVWMWQRGLIWLWALGTGLPTLLGLALAERGWRLAFPRGDLLPHPTAASTPAGRAAQQAVQQISRRLQAEDPPLDQPEALQKIAPEVFWEVLDTVACQYHPQAERPVLQVPVTHIAALVELVACDFRQAFAEKVPWGKSITPARLLSWKQKGELTWQITTYLWQLNRVRRLCFRPATALVQELQDHWGQDMATRSVGGLKLWAIDYCVTKAGDYAIQLYSGGFVLDDEYRPRISAAAETAPFDQEPLQVLVVGQVKAGKSSLINALLGETRAPVDTLPATAEVDLYECQPAGLPRMILRDTPGYGTVGEKQSAFRRLLEEIEECDLLVLVCTAGSAARQSDRELLHEIHEFFQERPQRIMPPVVYVMTHVDTVPAGLVAEAAHAVASDLGVDAAQIVAACVEAGRLANLEALMAAIVAAMPEAERLKCARCIRQIRKEQDENKVLRQILGGLRLTGGWMAGKP
jgi:uncharacterized protein